MSSTFAGFSEEDLQRIKLGESGSNSGPQINTSNIKRIDKLGARPKKPAHQYKLPSLTKQDSNDSIESFFDKCKLSIKTPTSPITPEDTVNNNEPKTETEAIINEIDDAVAKSKETNQNTEIENNNTPLDRKSSTDVAPDLVRCVDNYTEDELAAHKVKLEELQLKQKLMEEQNKKRKEMLAKALADRTKQTAEEVVRLEKIRKELQVLDGQFSQDVAVLRKKIDQACLSYADAEKHYLKVEKEFLQAKIQLQKEKEKKELLTEHLCALITHNETRKAQKLETLMLELATDSKNEVNTVRKASVDVTSSEDDKPVIIDGVDQKTGKIVEFTEP